MAINSFAENLKKIFLLDPPVKPLLCITLQAPITTITDWTLGREEPDIDTLIRIADFFQLSVDELVRGECHPPKRELKAPELLSKVLGSYEE